MTPGGWGACKLCVFLPEGTSGHINPDHANKKTQLKWVVSITQRYSQCIVYAVVTARPLIPIHTGFPSLQQQHHLSTIRYIARCMLCFNCMHSPSYCNTWQCRSRSSFQEIKWNQKSFKGKKVYGTARVSLQQVLSVIEEVHSRWKNFPISI